MATLQAREEKKIDINRLRQEANSLIAEANKRIAEVHTMYEKLGINPEKALRYLQADKKREPYLRELENSIKKMDEEIKQEVAEAKLKFRTKKQPLPKTHQRQRLI